MPIPRRLKRMAGRYALVDGIPFDLPVNCDKSPALFAVFPINADKAAKLLPGTEVHPLRLWKKGLLVVSVMDYRITDIGKYIEFSIAIACTHGRKPAPRLLPAIFMKAYGTGQFVVDLPVSTEVSVKGGKGIWGMPKHRANLNYVITADKVSSQYDLDGMFAAKIEMQRPKRAWLPLNVGAANYCQFRGLLMKSYIYFRGKLGFTFMKRGAARLIIGDHPRVQFLKELEIEADPILTAFLPEANGVLDDYFESWFLCCERKPTEAPEGLESVANLGRGEDWLPPPKDWPEAR
jgi:hypothetical protein